MAVYPRGKKYILSVGSGADRQRLSFDSQAEAEEAELEYQLEARKAAREGRKVVLPGAKKKPKDSSGKTLKDAFDRTWRDHWKDGKSAKTHGLNAGNVLKTLGHDTLLSDIDVPMIREAMDEWEDLGNVGSTINRKVSCLSMMLKTALDHEWLDKMPKLPRRKEGEHRICWLDEAAEAKAITMAQHLGLPDLVDYIIVGIDTGFRRGEVLGLTAGDVGATHVILHAGETKSDKARGVPMTDRVRAILTARKAGGRKLFPELTVSVLRYNWRVLREAMGKLDDPQWVPHMLRHTCASRLVQRGVPIATVQQWMGHATITTTLRYAHLSPNNLLDAAAILQGSPLESFTTKLRAVK